MEKILMCSFLLKFYLVNASTTRNYYRLSHSPGFCLFFTCCFFLRSVWYLFYSCLWCWAARCDCSPGTNAPAFLALKYWKHFQSSRFWFPEYIAGSKLLTVCTVWTFSCWLHTLGAWVAFVHLHWLWNVPFLLTSPNTTFTYFHFLPLIKFLFIHLLWISCISYTTILH